MDLKQQILTKSEELFLRYGLKSVTMDDIARELGVSKKTLYQYVVNKTDLIEQIFQQSFEEKRRIMRQIEEDAQNAIDELLNIAKYIVQEIRKLSPTVVYDLNKYYKTTWMQMESLHKQHIYGVIKKNVEKGIEQGLYRSDLHPDVIAKLYVGNTLLITEEDNFSEQSYNMELVFRECFTYHIHGIASPEGLQLLEQYIKAAEQKKIKKQQGM